MPIERFARGAALWRTRRYILPELKHFIAFAVLSGIAMLLELASTLVFFDLLTNKVFLGDPLSGTQASLLGLDPARFVDIETLDEGARFTLRTVFLVVAGALMASGFLLGAGLGYYLTWILQRVNQHLRLAMMDRAVHLWLRYHDEAPVGDAIYRVYQDSAMVTTVVQNALIQPVTALANLAIALVAIGFFEPYLGVLFLIAAIPSVLAGWPPTRLLTRYLGVLFDRGAAPSSTVPFVTAMHYAAKECARAGLHCSDPVGPERTRRLERCRGDGTERGTG